MIREINTLPHKTKQKQISTLCLKKVPTFKLSVMSSSVNRFSKYLHCWKAKEFATKPIRQYPSHLGHVAMLPWEVKYSNFLQLQGV